MTRLLPPRRSPLAAVFCALAAFAACEESSAPPTDSSPGTLTIKVIATGTDVDDRFSIQLNGEAAQLYVTGTPFVRTDLPASVYTVRISDVSSNCTVAGGNEARVTVLAGRRAELTFNLTCTARWLVVTQFAFNVPGSDLYRVSRTGQNPVRLTTDPAADMQAAVSPDGQKIAFVSGRDGGNLEIYLMNADGSSPVRLTSLPTLEWSPTWSPDGTRIAFVSESIETGDQTLRVMNADGGGVADVPGGGPLLLAVPVRWSPDGSRLAFTLLDAGSDYNVYSLALATGVRTRLTPNTATDISPSWTADGRIVYTAVAAGTVGGVFQMNGDGSGSAPLFDDPDQVEFGATLSPDGRWLAYEGRPVSGGPIRVYVVPAAGGTPVVATPDFFAREPAWQP